MASDQDSTAARLQGGVVNEVPNVTRLPLGDSMIRVRNKGEQPGVGALWLCGLPPNGRGASNNAAWRNQDGTWDFTRKPQVEGAVHWESEFQVRLDGAGHRIVTGNALPNTPTGVFPIDPRSVAYRFDRNPSSIASHPVNLIFDAMPVMAPNVNCMPFGANGISLTGAAIYHGSSTLGTDATAYEMLDSCGGQSDGTNTYHYHYPSDCLTRKLDPPNRGHSAIMGYMMDGFGIYGVRGEDGKVLSSRQLDVCHGHVHDIEWDGKRVSMYHYHWTYDFPYNAGCYRGTPVAAWNWRTQGSQQPREGNRPPPPRPSFLAPRP